MKKKTVMLSCALVLTIFMTIIAIFNFGELRKSSASVIKNFDSVSSDFSLSKVEYNGENMYVAKSSFYDYYSDTQVTEGVVPGEISDALDYSKNTMNKFNTRLLEIMKYGDANECPAKYPLYQGRQGSQFKDMTIFSYSNNKINEASNYWLGANNNQIGAYGVQGLVDSRLAYDDNRVSYVTQSNPDNGKMAYLPYFNKAILTQNKHKDSQLPLADVKENVSFPFRRVDNDGVTYYEFDSAKDTVRFNAKNQLDYYGVANKNEQVLDRYNTPGFFPYNVKADSNTNKLDYAYGVKIEVPFLTTKDGKIDGKDIIFEFTGDDDVWVFIDGILALDMGGAHPKISGNINFATKEATVSGVKNNDVAFASRTITGYGTHTYSNQALNIINVPTVYNNHKTAFTEELNNKLEKTDDIHILTLFYMERGMDVANMKMKFNLIEPTKLTVANNVNTNEVGDTFKEETTNIAKKDVFLYDVLDKTLGKINETDLIGGESVTFFNEFEEKNEVLVQQKGLKDESRKLTDLYSSVWLLKDEKSNIAKDKGLVINDTRTEERTVLMKNLDEKGVPVLDVIYANKPLVGKFIVVCDVSDKYKEVNPDYKTNEIKYVIKYSNVFGGGSQEEVYNGKYIVYNENYDIIEKVTTNGVVVLKPGEKLAIENVPVLTQIKVEPVLGEKDIIGNVITTDNLSYDEETLIVSGNINSISNIIEYVVDVKEEPKQEEKATEEPNQGGVPQEEPKQEEKATEEPNQGGVLQEEPKQEERATEEPNQGEVPQEEPKQEERATEEPNQGGSQEESNKEDNKSTKGTDNKIESDVNVNPISEAVKDELINKNENFTKKQIEEIIGEKVPSAVNPEKLESTSPNSLSGTVKTGDNSKIIFWLVFMIISILLLIVLLVVPFLPYLKKC